MRRKIRKNQLRLDVGFISIKEQEAIDFIRQHEPPEGYFVGFSGGKDSIVAYDLVKRSGVKYQAYFSNTLIEHKEIYSFIKKYYPEVIWLSPKINLWQGIKKFGPPFRKARWCCDKLKKDPAKNISLKHRVMGVRAEESYKRSKRPRIDTFQKQTTYKPIFNWLEWEVWEYIEKYKLPYPNLYDTGFSRVGCIICPMVKRTFLEDNPLAKVYKKSCKDWFFNFRNDRMKEKYKDQTFDEWWEIYIK